MMDIFESLENLNVSEECFDEIVGIVEEMLKDRMTVGQLNAVADKVQDNRAEQLKRAREKYGEGSIEVHRAQHRLGKASSLSMNDKQRPLDVREKSALKKLYPKDMKISQAKKVQGDLELPYSDVHSEIGSLGHPTKIHLHKR